MGRKTINLTPPFSTRIRHDQEERVQKIIDGLSEAQEEALINIDRARFQHDLIVRHGRPSNLRTVILRLALDALDIDELLEQLDP